MMKVNNSSDLRLSYFSFQQEETNRIREMRFHHWAGWPCPKQMHCACSGREMKTSGLHAAGEAAKLQREEDQREGLQLKEGKLLAQAIGFGTL